MHTRTRAPQHALNKLSFHCCPRRASPLTSSSRARRRPTTPPPACSGHRALLPTPTAFPEAAEPSSPAPLSPAPRWPNGGGGGGRAPPAAHSLPVSAPGARPRRGCDQLKENPNRKRTGREREAVLVSFECLILRLVGCVPAEGEASLACC